MVTDISKDTTEAGNYFISNYPPFGSWKKDAVAEIAGAFAAPATAAAPLGLYLHIPFCRKRCKFCYFRVYTDVNAATIQAYADALANEIGMIARQPAVQGRPVEFAYFGGGTPSYLSERQLRGLAARLREHLPWDRAKEVTFECEPGTLHEAKVQALREIGVTRLSLGVENFSDAILEENGRAHLSGEVDRAWGWIKAAGFAQTNIDLIAGMVGETDDNWTRNLARTLELAPDSVTIYQMELPYNTKYAKELQVLGQTQIAHWSVKRRWMSEAIDTLAAAGYSQSSAYTMVRKNSAGSSSFLYRDALWNGADLLASGVASFGHLSGVHYQNVDGLEEYQAIVAEGRLPFGRALRTTERERMIREMILQLKTGALDAAAFRGKFGVEILREFAAEFGSLVDEGLADIAGDRVALRRAGLLKVDSLLPRFFLPEHRTERYA